MAEDEVKQTAQAGSQDTEGAETVKETIEAEVVRDESAAKDKTEGVAEEVREETAGEGREPGGKAADREGANTSEDKTATAGDAADKKEEKKEIEPLEDIDTEWEAEKLCRWGAARASVLVVAPVLGTMALIANEVYMITRLADLRGVKISEGTALGLLGSLGATFIGQSVFTLLPSCPLPYSNTLAR